MTETQIAPNNPRFTEVLTNLFHELFKAAGVSMISIDGHEQIRTIAQKLTETIEHHAEWKAIEVSKIFQETVKNGFNNTERALLTLEKKIKQRSLDQEKKMEQDLLEQNKELNNLEQEFVDQKKRLDNLEQALLTIEKEIRQRSLDQEKKLDKLEQELLSQKREFVELQKPQQETSEPAIYKYRNITEKGRTQ